MSYGGMFKVTKKITIVGSNWILVSTSGISENKFSYLSSQGWKTTIVTNKDCKEFGHKGSKVTLLP